MDLISYGWQEKMRREGPLAYRMRPRSLGELVGQEKILGEGKPLQRMIAGGSWFPCSSTAHPERAKPAWPAL